jgi:hypothetical protein
VVVEENRAPGVPAFYASVQVVPFVHPPDRLAKCRACGVYKNIHASELTQHIITKSSDGSSILNISDTQQRAAAKRGDSVHRLLQQFRAAPRRFYISAVLGQPDRNLSAKPGRSAKHNRDTACQVQATSCHSPSPRQ